jgi:hypothetical protein
MRFASRLDQVPPYLFAEIERKIEAMRADWPHPSFQGQFLPLRHEIAHAVGYGVADSG